MHPGKTLAGSDEFLTYLEDIEKELALYHTEQFQGKHVWCPCDGADSNFTRYFKDNFARLGLKRLTATCLGGERYEYDGEIETISTLDNGDMFGSCVKDLWEAADVIATNPPFSRKFEFLSKLLSNRKQFAFLCLNLSAASFDFSIAIIAGQMWLG